jgi:hypothetical protein
MKVAVIFWKKKYLIARYCMGTVIESARRESDKGIKNFYPVNRIDNDIEVSINSFEENNKKIFCNNCAENVAISIFS